MPLEVSNVLQSGLKITLIAQNCYQRMEMILQTNMMVQGIRIKKDLLRCPMKLILKDTGFIYNVNFGDSRVLTEISKGV